MKKVRLPLMVQDPLSSHIGGIKIIEGYDAQREFFLDGPVTERVAIVDFDPNSGELVSGVRYNKGKNKLGFYENEVGKNLRKFGDEEIYRPTFLQTSTFAAVLKTIDLFEKKDALGRPLTWAFNAPQLLVIPRAGQMANAYYHRDTHSLQFFFFPSDEDPGEIIYSCLSRDIVAHETGHAIVDGIAPDLIDSVTPQSLALHEALADIIALLMAFTSNVLSHHVLEEEDGSIKDMSEFTTIAEEFGQARGHRDGLRNLLNEKNLNPKDKKNYVRRTEPHTLSEVLSGALYQVMIKIHEDLIAEYAQTPKFQEYDNPAYSASGIALAKGAERFKRMSYRALDYLPLGCVSFVDFGRAMIAVDDVAYPDNPKMRDWVREEFLRRHIATDKNSLQIHRDFSMLEGIDIPTLYASDWAAYEFANAHRDLLGIPDEIPFQIRPRLKVHKKYDHDRIVYECIFKVSWDQEEANPHYPTLPEKRLITVGTTLVFDWETGEILVLLTNARPPETEEGIGRGVDHTKEILVRRQQEYDQQRVDRDNFIQELMEEGIIKFGSRAISPDGKPLPSTVRAEVSRGFMRLKNTMNMLHITEVE